MGDNGWNRCILLSVIIGVFVIALTWIGLHYWSQYQERQDFLRQGYILRLYRYGVSEWRPLE